MVQQGDATLQMVLCNVIFHLLCVGCSLAHHHQMNIGRHVLECLYCQQYVLALFNTAYVEDETSGQMVLLPNFLQLSFGTRVFENLVTVLIDDRNLVGRNVSIFHDVSLGTLANGNNMCGFATGHAKLITINQHIPPMIIFWKA